MCHSAFFACYKALQNGNEAEILSHDLVLMNFIINSIVASSLVVVVHRTLETAKKTNFNISLLKIGAKLYHKLGNFLLPIGASVITKLGQLCFITN